MKILITSGIFPPDIGGPASYVPKLASYLKNRGHVVTVLCLSDYEKIAADKEYNFEIIRIKRALSIPLRMIKTICKIINLAKNVDIIYANTIAIESSIGAFLARKPIVHKVVGDYSWERSRNKGLFSGTIDEYQISNKTLFLKILDWLRNFPLKKADHIIVPSKYLKKIVWNWGISQKKITVVYNTVQIDEELIDKTSSGNSLKKLLTVSRLVPWKRVDGIIRALENYPDLELVIIGSGPLESDLKSLIKELHLERRIKMTGSLDRSNVIHHMNNSDLFILNSSYEGLPHVLIEAMTCGLPVISNRIGGCPEVVQDRYNGYIMDYNESEVELVKAISFFNENPTALKKYSYHAVKSIQDKFSFDKMVTESEEILKLYSLNGQKN